MAEVDSIIENSNKLLYLSQHSAALRYIDSAYSKISNPGPIDLWKKYSHLKNYYINYEFDVAKARLYVDSMVFIIKDREDLKIEHAFNHFANGDVFMAEKKYTEAFTQYYNGRAYALKNLDSCRIASFTSHLGLIKYRQMRFHEAIPYIKQAYNENKRCLDTNNITSQVYFPQELLNTLALCYEQLSMTDSAIYYYSKDLAMLAQQQPRFPNNTIDIERARGVASGNLGGVFVNIRQYDSARYYLTESIRLNDRPGYEINDAATARIKLAYLYIYFNKFNEAETEIKHLVNQIKNLKLKSYDGELLKLNLYKLTWTYYDKANNIKEAYYHQQRYYNFSDSLRKAEKDMRAADMDGAFKNLTQQYQLDLLNKEDQLKTFYLITVVVFCIMAGALLLAARRNLRRVRVANKSIADRNREINAQNEQINKQNSDMKQALSALEQSQAENTRMLKIVAHDLRNPIGGIKMAASLISRKLGDQAEDFQMLDIIKRSAENSLALVDELLKINVTDEKLKREMVDIADLISYCVTQLSHKAEAKQQQIKLSASPLNMPVNGEKIWRVISNLIANAIKFSPNGSEIKVTLKRYAQNAVISISDHGIGIPYNMKDKIFDLFTEAKRKGTAGEQSFGLGLAISKQLVEAHGGHIWFESASGTGTTFYIELPILDEETV